jgi:hypothetical protein
MILVFAMIASGCDSVSDDPAAPDNTGDLPVQIVDMDSPTGGFTETDEEPMFGEPEAYMELGVGEEEDDDFRDPLREEQHVRELERRHGVKIYRFRALWGRMACAVDDSLVTDECCTVDWSGGMALEGGVIVIEKVIRFDALDEIARTGPNTIRWKSMTCPHVDGVQVRLIVPPPPPPDSTSVEPADEPVPQPTLRIVAGPYERTFTLDELERLRLMQPVDRCNNYMSIASHRIEPGCPKGYLLGAWNRLETPDTLYNEETGEMRGVVHGRFKGIWIGDRGWAVGYLRGIYGVNSAGEQKFFGKYTNPKGEFMGILSGNWNVYPTFAYDPLNEMGGFEGYWHGRNHEAKGRVKGEWITAGGRGFFKGVWGMLCDERM